jgi:RNA polymerase sigma factor (sigma-70 family)
MNSTQATIVLHHLRRLAGTNLCGPAVDAELLDRFTTQRDEAAFAELVRRHGPMVFNVCRSVLRQQQDAEDAFQATFLILARKAVSIRRPEAVAGWLCEVAHRVAVKAQSAAAGRRDRERKAVQPMPASSALDLTLRDLQRTLHEELQQLPEKFRLPLVLCYLEGRSQDEAASQLGWTKGTLRGRLKRGRDQLRRRLVRRGVALAEALCAAELFLRTAPAPAALVDVVTRGALLAAAGKATEGLISARVSLLADGVGRTLPSSFKLVAVALFAAGLCAGAVALGHSAPALPAANTGAPAIAPAPAGKGDADRKKVTCCGKVLDPEGKPVAGAKLLLLYSAAKKIPEKVWATSGADGGFRFLVPENTLDTAWSEDPWEHTSVMAAAEGYGVALARLGKQEAATDITLRLVRDDVAVQGRILDLQGKPIAGVTVRIDDVLLAPKKADLTTWLADLRTSKTDFESKLYANMDTFFSPSMHLLIPPVATGADGRFVIKGLGAERVVRLRLEGPGLATQQFQAMTRSAQPVRRQTEQGTKVACYGSSFDVVALPGRVVTGVVRDRDTGKPLAGALIHKHRFGGVSEVDSNLIRTTSDASGRFVLHGLPKGEGYQVVAETPEMPYLGQVAPVADLPGLEPVVVNFDLARGMWVHGRVTEKGSGKPLWAGVEYYCFSDNPNLKGRIGSQTPHWYSTREDGTFRLVALPGPGLVAVNAHHDHYVRGLGATEVKGKRASAELELFLTVPSLFMPANCNRVVQIDPQPGDDLAMGDLVLDPGRTVTGVVLDPSGKPISGARVSGLKYLVYWNLEPLVGAEFKAESLTMDKPRLLEFVHRQRRLSGFVVLRADDKGPVRARLQPWGTLTGRLLTPAGDPLTGVEIASWNDGKGDVSVGSFADQARPDKEGRFRIEGLTSGLSYRLSVHKGQYALEITAGKNQNLSVKAGQTTDLGDIHVKPMP